MRVPAEELVAQVYRCACVCVCVCVYMCVYMCVYICVYMCVYICVYMCVFMCLCVYICILRPPHSDMVDSNPPSKSSKKLKIFVLDCRSQEEYESGHLPCAFHVNPGTHAHTYIYIHAHTYMYIHTHMYIYTHTHIYIYTHMSLCERNIHKHKHPHTCTHPHIYIHTHTHIYTPTLIYTHSHTYTHTFHCTFRPVVSARRARRCGGQPDQHARLPLLLSGEQHQSGRVG
jgi:rhodanese-related sulfurtransferase